MQFGSQGVNTPNISLYLLPDLLQVLPIDWTQPEVRGKEAQAVQPMEVSPSGHGEQWERLGGNREGKAEAARNHGIV